METREFDKVAARTLDRILRAFDEGDIDPDVVEAVPSDGVVQLDFGGQRRNWVVNSQAAAQQIWLAAEQRAWHFAHAGETPTEERWIAPKSGEELFATLAGLLAEHAGLKVDFPAAG